MKMMLCIFALASVCVSSVTAFGQTVAPEPVELAIKSTSKIDLPPSMFYARSTCDKEGNFYGALYSVSEEMPLVKVDAEGKVVARFHPSDSPLPGHFYVTSSGDVYELFTDSKRKNVVAAYNSRGEIKSRTILDGDFRLGGTFAVFNSGEFLVAMFEPTDGELITPYTAVFSADGKLVKKVEFEDDLRIIEAVKANDIAIVPSSNHQKSNSAIVYGDVLASSDGNAYVLRRTSPALIYVVSPAGRVLRKLTISPNEPALDPVNLFEFQGNIAVYFAAWGGTHNPASRLQVANRESGEIVRTFDLGEELKSSLACVSETGELTALGTLDRKPVLRHLSPK